MQRHVWRGCISLFQNGIPWHLEPPKVLPKDIYHGTLKAPNLPFEMAYHGTLNTLISLSPFPGPFPLFFFCHLKQLAPPPPRSSHLYPLLTFHIRAYLPLPLPAPSFPRSLHSVHLHTHLLGCLPSATERDQSKCRLPCTTGTYLSSSSFTHVLTSAHAALNLFRFGPLARLISPAPLSRSRYLPQALLGAGPPPCPPPLRPPPPGSIFPPSYSPGCSFPQPGVLVQQHRRQVRNPHAPSSSSVLQYLSALLHLGRSAEPPHSHTHHTLLEELQGRR